MANKLFTVFQNLEHAIDGKWDANSVTATPKAHVNTYNLSSKGNGNVIYKTDDKIKYAQKKLEAQQNAYLSERWRKANVDLSLQAFNGLNNIKLMYRDADLMDAMPEIGAALNIYSEEATCLGDSQKYVVNVYSKSSRVKSILEDLFINRLDLQTMAQMVIRGMCKYGNQFMLLNIDKKNGVMGWRQLPVYSVERLENGISNPYGSGGGIVFGSTAYQNNTNTDMSTQFIWTDDNETQVPFRNWQIGHFRLINNSMFLPYGASVLQPARRHFLMLSRMEDMMLIYRLERSIERRVYKIYVGAIDDADVEAYVNEIANNFKRTPIIDPVTGQLDLRKNVMDITQDLFIPCRDPNQSNPIDTLSPAQNLTAIDDIKYIQQKVLAALQIPKSFLNFEDAVGDGKNLAMMDIRFTRTINRIQQAFLMELTKIATIHLFLLGFTDDLTNFSLSMNNPSTQAEQLQIDNIAKKIATIRDAVGDPGTGIPIMSTQRALKEIMKWSDKEIQENFEEIRLEKGLATELEKTSQIIKKTGVFDKVDRIYGEPGAKYQDDGGQGGQGGEEGMGGMLGGGGGGMPDMGGGDNIEDLGMPGAETEGEINGVEGEMPMDDAQGGNDQIPMENILNRNKPLLMEVRKIKEKKQEENIFKRADIYDKSLLINEEFTKMANSLDDFIKDEEKEVL